MLSGPPTVAHVPPLNRLTWRTSLVPLDSSHATYGMSPTLVMVGRPAAFVASMLSEPPTAVQAPALNRLTWTSSFAPFDSAHATNGTPFTFVRAGSPAGFVASMLSEPS